MFIIKRTFIVFLVATIFVVDISFGAVVRWGEKCQFTAECSDHRLVCEEITSAENVTEKICVCDRFHEWNGTFVGCVLKYKTEDIIALLDEKYNVAAEIEYDANLIFFAQMSAGFLVIIIGLLCSVFVAGYCFRMWKQDTDLDTYVRRLQSERIKNKNRPTTSRLAR